MRNVYIVLVSLLLLPLAGAGSADEVVLDLFGGIGGFESVSDVVWISTYAGPDYDFHANSGYLIPGSGERRLGYNLPQPDDTVATGWLRYSEETVNPGKHIVFRVLDGEGSNGSRCQYFALKDVTGGKAVVRLKSTLRVDDQLDSAVHAGDSVTFTLDHIRMAQFADLPQGASVSYRMTIGDTGIPGGHTTKPLTPSAQAFSEDLTYEIPPGVSNFAVIITMETSGNLGDAQPGIYVDGAHLFVRRAGQSGYETRTIPVPRKRNINTLSYLFHPTLQDEYWTAYHHDAVVAHSLMGSDYSTVLNLKYYNPSIKVYLDQTGGTIWDVRDAEGQDPWSVGSAFGMRFVLDNDPSWLYDNGAGFYVNQVAYPHSYHVRTDDLEYQNLWAQKVIEKVHRYGFDGVFIDDLETKAETYEGSKKTCITRDVWEVQSFLHAVAPRLKAAGVELMRNAGTQHLLSGERHWWFDQLQGRVYFYPFWTPTSPYDDLSKYSPNTPASVGDGAFNEWAFLKAAKGAEANVYDSVYWLRCLEDMDEVKRWNTAAGDQRLAPSDHKWQQMFVVGWDKPDDPAVGVNGWLQFGLTSYLLAQNELTIYACAIRPYDRADVDYSAVAGLGVPNGDHLPYNGDEYCRYRLYTNSAPGDSGGVVVVNAHADVVRTYTVGFDAVDLSGNAVPAGTTITLGPHTGRILFRDASRIDLAISVLAQAVAPGQTISVTVNYTNNGTDDLSSAVVRAVVPSEVTYVPGSAEATGGSFDPDTNTVSWTIPTIPAGSSGDRTFEAVVN